MCPGTAGTLSGTWCGVAARAGESIPEGVSRARATTLTRLIVELVRYGPLDDRNVTCGREDDNRAIATSRADFCARFSPSHGGSDYVTRLRARGSE